jgi:hypothetical protein
MCYFDRITYGTHFFETKLVVSMTDNPVSESILMNLTFSADDTICFSFYNPSLGPTSTILANLGNVRFFYRTAAISYANLVSLVDCINLFLLLYIKLHSYKIY